MTKKLVQRLDEIINFYVDDKEFMGSVLVAKNNQVLLHKGYGFANLEWYIPNTPKTKFRLGSLTKQFTAAAILILEERGLLSTDDLIRNYIPKTPKIWKDIKIAHLLNHTHGIPNYTQLPIFRTITTFPKKPWEQIELFIDKPLDFQPGTSYYYNNSGYVLLGYLIEYLNKQSYAEFIKDNIFKPLKMYDSGYDDFLEIIPHRASGYSKNPYGDFSNAEYLDMSIPYAAGSLYSTTDDLQKWTENLFGFNLLSKNSVDKMTTPGREHYGFGLEIKDIEGMKAYMHTGGINGFHSFLIYCPSTKTTISALSNLNTFGYVWDIGFLAQGIALKLFSILHGKNIQLPIEKNPVSLSTEKLKLYCGEYKIKEGLNLLLRVQNNNLEAIFTNQLPIILKAANESSFYSITPEIYLNFLKNSDGKNQLKLIQSGYELIGNKI